MAADSNLIKGEALVAQSGNVNYGEEIGKGFETIGKSIAEAKDTVKGWSEKESELNEAMRLVDTDDLLSKENEAVSEFLTQGKLKYAEAAKKASRITNKSSKEYKDLVKIMNNVNTSFKNLAKEKQDILDARVYLKENPNAFSAANDLDEDADSYFGFAKGETPLLLNEEGHFVIEGKQFRNLKAPSTKSPINATAAQVLVGTYNKVKKDGKELTENEIENMANGLAAQIMSAGDQKTTARQVLLDPLFGDLGLLKETDVEFETIGEKDKDELIALVKDKYKEVLRNQSNRGVGDYDPPKTELKDSTVFTADDALKSLSSFVTGTGGSEDAVVRNKQFKVVQDPRDKNNPKVVMYGADGKVGESINLYVTDKLGIPMKDAQGNAILNTQGFRALTGEYSQIKIKN
jgi:hypothetical protein